MKLAYKTMGEGPALIILHGLFGSADNWQTLGKEFAKDFKVFLVDQRNHGRSPHSEVFNYDVLANDLKSFMIDQGISKASIIGHSMGGKTAMRFAQIFPAMVHQLVIADMGIKSYPAHHGEVFRAFHAVKLEGLESRTQADDILKPILPEFGTRQFILKSLYRKTPEVFAWRPNFVVLEKEMDSILAALPEGEVNSDTLFLYGSKSNYILPEDFDSIKKIFPKAKFVEMAAGHWLHAEKPKEFYKNVMDFVT